MSENTLIAIISAAGVVAAAAIGIINARMNKTTNPRETDNLALLAQKIYQCNILMTFIPTWLIEENKYDSILANATEEELNIVSNELLQFIFSSISDQWSAAFFRNSYDKIPCVETLIVHFRARIQEFYKDLDSASKNREILKIAWSTILRQELFNLRIDALKIKEAAVRLHDDCLAELHSQSKNPSD